MPVLPPKIEPVDVFDASAFYTENAIESFQSRPENQFNIDQLRYPEDLGSAPHLQHYITFDILVRGKSKFNKDGTKVNPNSVQSPASLDDEALATAATKGAEIVTSAGVGLATAGAA